MAAVAQLLLMLQGLDMDVEEPAQQAAHRRVGIGPQTSRRGRGRASCARRHEDRLTLPACRRDAILSINEPLEDFRAIYSSEGGIGSILQALTK